MDRYHSIRTTIEAIQENQKECKKFIKDELDQRQKAATAAKEDEDSDDPLAQFMGESPIKRVNEVPGLTLDTKFYPYK